MSNVSSSLLARVLLAVTLVACGGSSALSSGVVEARGGPRDVGAVDDRIQGKWRLVEYRPEVAPDPMFQALLTAYVGTLVVRFERGSLHADAPTFHLTRGYRIVQAAGPLFTVESPDVGGAVFTTKGAIAEDGQRITFRCDTEPWRGSGTLVRAQ